MSEARSGATLIELRNALKSSDDPISNATINTLFASLSSAYGYFVEQGWCSENPLRLIEDLEVAERPFTWLQSAVVQLRSVVEPELGWGWRPRRREGRRHGRQPEPREQGVREGGVDDDGTHGAPAAAGARQYIGREHRCTS